jgi:hypothetical protein
MPVNRNVTQKSIKETKIQKSVYGDIRNVECEIRDYTCYNWSHRNSNKRF